MHSVRRSWASLVLSLPALATAQGKVVGQGENWEFRWLVVAGVVLAILALLWILFAAASGPRREP